LQLELEQSMSMLLIMQKLHFLREKLLNRMDFQIKLQFSKERLKRLIFPSKKVRLIL
jgi:hypothetical protein